MKKVASQRHKIVIQIQEILYSYCIRESFCIVEHLKYIP